MGNRHATTAAPAGSVDGKKNSHRSAVAVVPIDANDHVELPVGNGDENRKKKSTLLRERSSTASGKNQKRKKRLRLQSKSSSPMPRSDMPTGAPRQLFVPPYPGNGLAQQQVFYPHPMNSCYYPPGAVWQHIPSPWLPKGFGVPMEPRSFFPAAQYQHWEKMMLAPPRSQSVEALCDQPTLRRHTSSVDFTPGKSGMPVLRPSGGSPFEPGGRLFKFSTSLRPHLADALPRSQDRPPSATSGRGVFVEELDFDAIDCSPTAFQRKVKSHSTVANGSSNSKETQERPVVVTMDAQTIMERNARLLADAEKMERLSDQSKQLSLKETKCLATPVGHALHKQQSLSDLRPYPFVNGSGGLHDSHMNGNVQAPAKELYFGSNDDQTDSSRSVSAENGRRSVEQGATDKSAAADGRTPTMDGHSEIDFSWIADLENRLDRSSDQISRARKSSMDTSSISISTVGQQSRMTASMSNSFSRNDSIAPEANSSLVDAVSARNGPTSQWKRNGYPYPNNDCVYTDSGSPRRFAMWRRTPEAQVPVYIPEPDYD